jgi:hypothetical protein
MTAKTEFISYNKILNSSIITSGTEHQFGTLNHSNGLIIEIQKHGCVPTQFTGSGFKFSKNIGKSCSLDLKMRKINT